MRQVKLAAGKVRKQQSRKRVTNLSKYEWMFFTQSYLSLGRIGIEELKGENYIRKTSFEYYFSYENRWLLIAIVWNIKHAIELIVKSLGVCINKQYLTTHDSNNLFNDLRAKIPDIKKPEVVEKLADIVFKYYKCEFFDKKILNNINVFDIQNDIFRFPDNSAQFNLNLEIFKNLNYKNIKELLDDIKNIDSYLGIIDSQITKVFYDNKRNKR